MSALVWVAKENVGLNPDITSWMRYYTASGVDQEGPIRKFRKVLQNPMECIFLGWVPCGAINAVFFDGLTAPNRAKNQILGDAFLDLDRAEATFRSSEYTIEKFTNDAGKTDFREGSRGAYVPVSDRLISWPGNVLYLVQGEENGDLYGSEENIAYGIPGAQVARYI